MINLKELSKKELDRYREDVSSLYGKLLRDEDRVKLDFEVNSVLVELISREKRVKKPETLTQ
jgi:hypothetical protein